MKTREQVVFDGTCYNFALLIVEKQLVEQGRWTAEEATRLASELSEKAKKTVSGFLVDEQLITRTRPSS